MKSGIASAIAMALPRAWQPLAGFAGVLLLIGVAVHAVPVLWEAVYQVLGAAQFALERP